VRAPKLFLCVCVAAVVLGQRTTAQPITFSLFERYLESLRQQVGIPGLSAAIVQGRRVAWEAGLGHRDVDGGLPATPDTPYPIADLTQTFATVMIGQCVERGVLDLAEPIRKWSNAIPESDATVRHVLAHASDSSARAGFRYDPDRYASLTLVAEACAGEEYRRLIAREVLDLLGMADSLPSRDLAEPSDAARHRFAGEEWARYAAVATRIATPYRVDRSGRAVRSNYSVRGLDASLGVISSVRDLALYDAALDNGKLLRRDILDFAWRNTASLSGATLPTGLGWFVQTYNGERLVWHFGMAQDAYSSLILKVPGRELTLILLANSDGLSATFSLAEGDVTSSLFARTFLRLFL
jgi:CubicO group peptidase (beta-lactamase class C family)